MSYVYCHVDCNKHDDDGDKYAYDEYDGNGDVVAN